MNVNLMKKKICDATKYLATQPTKYLAQFNCFVHITKFITHYQIGLFFRWHVI